MRSLFIITEQMNLQQQDNSYLLCIAMLNFEHEVNVLFLNNAFSTICAHEASKKKWQALKLYGVNKMYQLQDNNTCQHDDQLTTIDLQTFEHLKNNMDMIT